MPGSAGDDEGDGFDEDQEESDGEELDMLRNQVDDLTRELAQVQVEAADAQSRLESDCHEACQELRGQMATAQQEHAQQLRLLSENHTKAGAELKEQLDEAIVDKVKAASDHQKEMAKMQAEWQAKLADALKAKDEEILELKEQVIDLQGELDTRQRQGQGQESTLHSECEVELEALKGEHLAEIKRMADYLEEMRLKHEDEMARLKAEQEAKADAQLRDIRAGQQRERQLQKEL